MCLAEAINDTARLLERFEELRGGKQAELAWIERLDVTGSGKTDESDVESVEAPKKGQAAADDEFRREVRCADFPP